MIRSKFEHNAKLFPILIAKAKKGILWRISWHNCLYNYIFSCFSPLSFSHFVSFPCVRCYNGFYSKTRAWEGVEHLLTQLVAMALVVINNFFLTPCFVHRVDAEPPLIRDGTAVPSFLYFSAEHRGTLSLWTVEKGLRLAAVTSWDSTYGFWRSLS